MKKKIDHFNGLKVNKADFEIVVVKPKETKDYTKIENDARMTFRLPEELKQLFLNECEKRQRKPADILRDSIIEYLKKTNAINRW